MKLVVAGEERQLSADYSLRFVQEPWRLGGETFISVEPVLYFRGKRISKGFSIEINCTVEPDGTSNANTAD